MCGIVSSIEGARAHNNAKLEALSSEAVHGPGLCLLYYYEKSLLGLALQHLKIVNG